MTAVEDGNVVMHAPEERDSGEFYCSTQHVERRCLALTLRNNPVLDANILAGMRIRPAGDIAGGKNVLNTRLKIAVHQHTAIKRQAGCLGKLSARANSDPDHHKVGLQGVS